MRGRQAVNGGGALIVGGDSMIGVALRRAIEQDGGRVVSTTRGAERTPVDDPSWLTLDLANAAAVERFEVPAGIDRVYLLAAATSLRACRLNPESTRRVNVDAARRLVQRALAVGALPVLASTNLVFAGAGPRWPAEAALDPRCVYGQQKADAERAVRRVGGTVVRMTKVIGADWPVAAAWRTAWARGEAAEAYADMWIAPVPVSAACEALRSVKTPGEVVQVSAERDLSYVDAARHLADRLGVGPGRVVSRRAADAGVPAEERPRHTSLAGAVRIDPYESLGTVVNLS